MDFRVASLVNSAARLRSLRSSSAIAVSLIPICATAAVRSHRTHCKKSTFYVLQYLELGRNNSNFRKLEIFFK